MRRIVGYELKTLDNLITRKILLKAKNAGYPALTTVQIRIMRYLFLNQDKEIYQRDIERNFVVRRSTASGIISTMEKNGMLKRIESSLDLRVKRIILTDKYIDRMELLESLIDEFQNDLLDGISDNELNTFFSVIDKMKDNLNK
ncbi:MAG: MarR family transcriptional regulator [Bacilli bacterium]|nr:MarR family transcriptional regulator [Bacilli bacterium]